MNLKELQNTRYEYVSQLSFNNNCLDAQTLCNIFLEAVILSQTTTSPQSDIISLYETESMRIAKFANVVAWSNMKRNFDRLVNDRLPRTVQDRLGFELEQSTNRYPKVEVA